MKKIKQILSFLLQLILWVISWILQPIVELATFIVVLFQYKWNALNYFNGKGLEADFRSARDNRSLWNFILVNKNGKKFTRDMEMTISAKIGENSLINGLTWFGWILYYLLYLIDVSSWLDCVTLFTDGKVILKKGHCKEAYFYYILKKQKNGIHKN